MKSLGEKLRAVFPDAVVPKNPDSKFWTDLGLPSFLRDWTVRKFIQPDGSIDMSAVERFVRTYMPRKRDWERIKSTLIHEAASVKILTTLRVEIDVATGEALVQFPALGFPKRKREARVEEHVLKEHKSELLSGETWGVVELRWRREAPENQAKEIGRVVVVDFKPFRPYRVDIEHFCSVRREFSLPEWVDVLLGAIDYNPAGFSNLEQKIWFLCRLIPFVQKNFNLIELAPKGTGKTYIFSRVSKYGWLVSGGSISRAKMFYDISRRREGLVSLYDFVALDEVQTISFPDESEIRGALKGYLETGEYRVGDYHGKGEAGLILLGNVTYERQKEGAFFLQELPEVFRESALIDRFHAFLPGWRFPRMRQDMRARGWCLNTEYFSEVLHELRSRALFMEVTKDLLEVPKRADVRDTNAIMRATCALTKLLLPHLLLVDSLSEEDIKVFEQWCLRIARAMRRFIRQQLHMLDAEYPETIPDITLRSL
ncbi:MAG: BREX system Lon protease-like protein BrxL [Planctomycetota bacterium]|nr:MAG: BREX system Lon protease-like protein BrxL [Planctomycetota bacterium]